MTATDQTDEYGVSLKAYIDASLSVSPKAADRVQRRAERATSNFLYAYGLPTQPIELLHFANMVSSTVLATALVDGFVVQTEAGTATEEEKAERAQAAAEHPQRQEDPLAALAAAINGQNVEPGGYL